MHDSLSEEQLQTIASYNTTARQFASSIARLTNYDHTYDTLIDLLQNGDCLLDLACGPAQISHYITTRKTIRVVGVDLSPEMLCIAKKQIPDGLFYTESMVTFRHGGPYDAIVLGFGLPYLNEQQVVECLANASSLLKPCKPLYVSFMHGRHSRCETTSFGGDHTFLIHYHPKDTIQDILHHQGLQLLKEFELDYHEPDDSMTKDVIFIAQKSS